jgi:uncharacterized coiled-coil protein SlyX
MAPSEGAGRRSTNRGVWYNVPQLVADVYDRLRPSQYWYKLHIEVRKFIRWAIFALLFTVIIVLKKPTEIDFYLTDRVRFFLGDAPIDQLPYMPDEVQYRDITTISDIWSWMERTVVPGVYNTTVPNAFEGDMLGYNIVLGGVRMKQQKSRPVSCPAPPDAVISVASVCFLEFDPNNVVTDAFGAVNQYRFYTSNQEGQGFSFSYWGQLGWYPSDGYIVDFGRNISEVYLLMQQLQNDDWLDVSTRSVVVEISIYNPYLMTFSLGSFLMELPPGGGVITTSRWSTQQMLIDSLPSHRHLLGLEFLFVISTFLMVYEECVEMRTEGFATYWKQGWNWLDWTNLLILLGIFIMRIQLLLLVRKESWNVDDFIDIPALGRLIQNESNLLAVNGLCIYLKVFKFLNQVPYLSVVFRTLAARPAELVQFIGLFFVIFFGFVVAFNLAFSGQVFEFRTITQTFYSLFQVLLGRFDFYVLYKVDRVLTSLLFSTFVIVCWWTLLSVFIAILNDTYSFTKETIRLELEAVKSSAEKKKDDASDASSEAEEDTEEEGFFRWLGSSFVTFLKYGFNPRQAKYEADMKLIAEEEALYADVLVEEPEQQQDEPVEVVKSAPPPPDKPWSEYLEEAVEWGHYPRLHRATDQVTELERQVVTMNDTATEMTEAVTHIKGVLQRMDEKVASLPEKFLDILEKTNGDVRLKTVSRRLDLLVKTIVFETHVDPRVLRKSAPPPTISSKKKLEEPTMPPAAMTSIVPGPG